MVDQGDAQPKGPCQGELVNLGCLLPYQNHQWKRQNANEEKKKVIHLQHFSSILANKALSNVLIPLLSAALHMV
jgi:hypothetical protein